jgi:hypothetical protein
MPEATAGCASVTGTLVIGVGIVPSVWQAVTEHAAVLGGLQAQRMAGHAHVDMTLQYTQADCEPQDRVVRELQARVRGNVVEMRKRA